MDCSPPGPSVHGISQARILEIELVDISFSKNLPDPGIESASLTLAGGFFPPEPSGKPNTAQHIDLKAHALFLLLLFSLSVTLGFSLSQTLTQTLTLTLSCLTLCDPMDCSIPGFPVLHCPRVCSYSCPLSRWCHPITSFSVTPFSSCPQSFPASECFPISQLFALCGQSVLELHHQSFQWIFRVDFL